ncbi:MAG TPA: DegV family protein [Anaerolineaceae bacterium]|nr:DegV family protein [Anaerolineaceae bacterium]HNZ14600.1 DegV family protein [Anaerolineaceae bacterium]HOH92963.1 DegV family protein [Anaerolineaceae bacterium]
MIKIIADTTCGIPVATLKAAGIEVLPQIITFGNDSYRDDTELDTATFLSKLRKAKELPKTAAPPHSLYTPIYEKILNAGDSALVITPSAEVSGTYRSAMIAAKEFDTDRIQIVDTRTIAGGLGSIVLQAQKWSNEGIGMEELVGKVQSMLKREYAFFIVPTLDYLLKGGRIGGAAKLVGTLLKIVPILTVDDGKVATFEKVRTLRQAKKRFINLIVEACKNNPDPHLSISHCDNIKGARELKSAVEKQLRIKDIPIYLVPPAIVVHAGPDLLSMSCFLTQEKHL